MDFLKFLNNGYDPALILGYGALGFRPLRIIEGTGRNTQIHGNYGSQTQVFNIPPQELKIDVVERDKKGKVKKVLQTLDFKSASQKIAELVGDNSNDLDDSINLIALHDYAHKREEEERRQEDLRRKEEYRQKAKKHPILRKLYKMEHNEEPESEEEKEQPKAENDIDFYKRRISEIEKEIDAEETKHLLSKNPTSINRKIEGLRTELKEYEEKLKEAEGNVKVKYTPGKRGNVLLNEKAKEDIENFNFTILFKYFDEELHTMIHYLNDNNEVVDLEEEGTLNENYFTPSYIKNTIANTELYKKKTEALFGKEQSLKAGGILEKNLTVNEEEDFPEEIRIKSNIAKLITKKKSVFKDMDTVLGNIGYSGETSTFYDAFNKKAQFLAEIKKYTTYGKDEVVEAFMTSEHSYQSLLEVRRTNMNNYWLYLKQQIIKLYEIYNKTKNKTALENIYDILDKLTANDYEFSIDKFERLYRKNNNYVGIPIAINKFPMPSPSTWNEEKSPNTLGDVKHIREKRKTNYKFNVSKTFKIKRVIDENQKSGKSNTKKLDELLFEDGEEYDVVYIVLLDDALLFFNLSDYLRTEKDEPVNLFELTDSYYTDTKKGEYDSLNIPIELFESIDLLNKNDNDEPIFYGGERYKKVKVGKTFKNVPVKQSQYNNYVNTVNKEIDEYKEEQKKKKKVNKSTKGKIINI